MPADSLLAPVIEHGPMGIIAGLLMILVWLIKRLLLILEDTGSVIAENTAAIRSLDTRSAELLRLTHDMRDRLLTRACLIDAD